MVERRQPKAEDATTSLEERALQEPAGTDAEEARQQDALLDSLPGGLAPLPSIHDDLAAELLALAEQQLAETRKKFGREASKPKLKRILSLFNDSAGRAPSVDAELARQMRSLGAVQQTAQLDGVFDRALATALNVYDKTSVQSGANVQSAQDNWSMAVRVYKSELRAAGAVLRAEIEAVNHPPAQRDFNEYEEPLRGASQVQHYLKSAKIGQSLLTYEKTMQQAGAALVTAYGQLTAELFAAVNTLAVAEATLISATQSAYSTFWNGVQSAVAQSRS